MCTAWKISLFTALAVAWSLPADAAITADFDGGNSGAVVDAYPGTSGDGWSGAWQTSVTGASFTSGPTVDSTTPLTTGGGNYLASTITTSAGNGQGAVVRQYGDFGDIDITKPHTIHFQYRAEDLSTFSHGEDRYQMFASSGVNNGTNTNADWIIMGFGGDYGTADVDGTWVVFNGEKNNTGFSASNLIGTGVPIVAGQTYDVAVTVYPSVREWGVTISDGTNTYSTTTLGFRRSATSLATYLHFGGRANASGETRQFSVDGIEITAAYPEIRADFTRGTGSTYVDQLGGTAGRGWTNAWSGAGTGTSTVISTNPLDASDPNYLSVTSTATGDRVVRREIESYGQVNTAQDHRITWKWRFDGDASLMTSFSDRIHFYADDAAGGGTGAGDSWIIGWVGGDSGSNDMYEGNWYFYDRGSNSNFDLSNMVDTGMGLEAGRVYDFSVIVHPDEGTYDATISDGVSTFTATDLTFRNNSIGEFNYLHFGGSISSTYLDNAAEPWAFSLDSIVVTAIPEPGCWMALAGMAGTLFLFRRRRRTGAR